MPNGFSVLSLKEISPAESLLLQLGASRLPCAVVEPQAPSKPDLLDLNWKHHPQQHPALATAQPLPWPTTHVTQAALIEIRTFVGQPRKQMKKEAPRHWTQSQSKSREESVASGSAFEIMSILTKKFLFVLSLFCIAMHACWTDTYRYRLCCPWSTYCWIILLSSDTHKAQGSYTLTVPFYHIKIALHLLTFQTKKHLDAYGMMRVNPHGGTRRWTKF